MERSSRERSLTDLRQKERQSLGRDMVAVITIDRETEKAHWQMTHGKDTQVTLDLLGENEVAQAVRQTAREIEGLRPKENPGLLRDEQSAQGTGRRQSSSCGRCTAGRESAKFATNSLPTKCLSELSEPPVVQCSCCKQQATFR